MIKSNASGQLEFEGFLVEFLDKLKVMLGFQYKIHLSYDLNYGSRDPVTGQWNGMVREILDNVSRDITFTSTSFNSSSTFTLVS